MPARDLPNLGLKAGYDPGENGWGDDMTENLLKLSTLTQATVIDKVAATPGSPAAGDVYLFSAAHPTNANDIAIFDGPTGEEAWTYVTPDEGWLVFNKAADYYEKFDGSAWAELATGGGGGGGIADAPADGKLYGRQDNDWEEIISGDGDGVAVVYEETLSTGLALNAHRQIALPSGFNRFRIVVEIPTIAAVNPEIKLQVGGSDVATTHHRWGSESGNSDNQSGTTILSMRASSDINNSSPTMVAELEKEADGRWRVWGSVRSKEFEGLFAGKTAAAAVLTSFSVGSSNGAGFPAGTYIRVERPGSAGDVVHPFRGCRAERTANIAVGGVATIPWTSEVYDYGGWHDNATNNTRFTVPAGVTRVRITGQFTVQSPSGGQSFSVRKNGNTSVQYATAQVGNSAFTFSVYHFDTGTIEVSPGDYFEAYSEGSSTLIPSRTFFQIEAVSDKVARADLSPTLNAQAASYSLVAADDGNIVEMTSASANTVTIPANATTGIAVGSTFSVVQIGAGATTIQAAAGVTLNGVSEGSADISGQWGGVSLYKRGPDQWVIQGAHGGVS